MTTRILPTWLTILAIAAALASGGTAFAQGAFPPPQQQQQQQQPAKDFSDADLEAFAEAIENVNAITREYQLKAQSIQEPAQVAELRQEANLKTVQAVRDAGLEVDQYNAIANAAQRDPALAEKIEGM